MVWVTVLGRDATCRWPAAGKVLTTLATCPAVETKALAHICVLFLPEMGHATGLPLVPLSFLIISSQVAGGQVRNFPPQAS